jgi:uncharacterized protein YkwD
MNHDRLTRSAALGLMLAALAAPAAAAQQDLRSPITTAPETVAYGVGVVRTCSPAYQTGVQGRYGAWGYYVSGCTVRLTCPKVARTPGRLSTASCKVSNRSTITTENWAGHRVTLNTRIRIFGTNGAVRTWRDRSCQGTDWCRAQDVTWMYPGESVQCNGVRALAPNRGRVPCELNLQGEGYCTQRNTPITQLSQAEAEATVLCLTNLQRYKAGLPALIPDDQLTSAARGHALAAVTSPWWTIDTDWHTDPYTKSTPTSRLTAAGYCPSPKIWTVAENVYWGAPGPTPYSAVRWWMGSEGHRKNILDPNLSEIGIGVVRGSPDPTNRAVNAGTFVQNFGNCINY